MSSPIQLPQRTPASPSEPSSGVSWSQVDPELDPVHFVVTLGGDATAACSTATEEAAMAEEAPQETRASMGEVVSRRSWFRRHERDCPEATPRTSDSPERKLSNRWQHDRVEC